MKNTPCYYGIVKAMVTLQAYQKRFGKRPDVQEKLNAGLQVMLKHHLYQRLSNGEAIEPSIVENFYPYPYKPNLIEMLGLMKANGLLDHEAVSQPCKFCAANAGRTGSFRQTKCL